MTIRTSASLACAILTIAAAPALAFNGGNGGDREPAGGAFMSSYTAPGTTGVQDYGPPRSVDIPRNGYYLQGDRWVPRTHDRRYYR